MLLKSTPEAVLGSLTCVNSSGEMMLPHSAGELSRSWGGGVQIAATHCEEAVACFVRHTQTPPRAAV